MATLASVQIDFNFGKLSIDGFPVEVFRVLGPIAAADTAVIVPNRFELVKAVIGAPGVHDLPSTGLPATNVTITMRSSAASGQNVDVILVGFQRN